MSISDPNYVKTLLIKAKKQKRYLSARSLTKKTVVPKALPKMTTSRIWKKFSIKVLTGVVLPTIVFILLFALVMLSIPTLIYFGMAPNVASVVGPVGALAVPFLIIVMRRLYKESIDEVKSENKELMRDMKGY